MTTQPQTPEPLDDPFRILGLESGTSEELVRAKYLQLVRENPPELRPEKFRQIHDAYVAASDPLVVAKRLVDRRIDEPRPWADVIREQASNPPRLEVETLLSLGNRSETTTNE